MKQIKLLSIVLPCYKQEKTIYKNLLSLQKTLLSLDIPFEIIAVIDGNVDRTHGILKDQKSKIKNLKIIEYEKNQGKGYAVKFGMLKARGDVIGFLDAGMEIDPESIKMLLNHMNWYNADVIVGSKLHPVSLVEYPMARKILSFGYRTFTRVLFGFKVRDTQVGLKLFKRKVVISVFPKLLVKKFAFDIEVLAVSYNLGHIRIYEAPVKLNFKGSSTITSGNFWRVILHMVWDTFAVYYRLKVRHQYDKIKRQKELI